MVEEMSFNHKKPYCKAQEISHAIGTEKENIYAKLRKRTKYKQQDTKEKVQIEDSDEFERLLMSPQNEKDQAKPLSFWSKKLKELEIQKNTKGKRKCGLYEFNETTTEESMSPYEKKKHLKQKYGIKKKNEEPKLQYRNKTKGLKQVKFKPKASKTMESKQKIMSNIENPKLLSNENEKFTFLQYCPSNFTSTPARKDNIIGILDFTHLSPVEKEDSQQFMLLENSFRANNVEQVKCLESQSPKTTKILPQANKRVLRSKKLITEI